jgi:hypothetical protein
MAICQALLSSDDFGSSVGRRCGCHPVYGDAWIDGGLAWVLGGARASKVPTAGVAEELT